MAKRTLKPAAGESRVSLRDATSAARVVYRDGTTGRFVILERGHSGRVADRSARDARSKGIVKDRTDSPSHRHSSTVPSKKR
jgi:hypothetical protein